METSNKESDQDTIPKVDLKESLEERHNKLRGFAVKLKKKVNDLTEELKICESEKTKAINEKDEFQKKLSQISDTLKQLQTIQLEYDKLQDNLETEKNENKKLTKNLETVVLESTGVKQLNYELRENVARLTTDLENRSREVSELNAALKKSQGAVKKLEEEKKAEAVLREQKEKIYEEVKSKLESEIQSHRATRAQCTSNSVLVLEVDNYEKSIEDLKLKLSDESSRCESLENIMEEQRGALSDLEKQLSELREACFAKSNQLTVLSDKNESLKSELCILKQEIVQMTKEKQTLVDSMQAIKSNADKLTTEVAKHVEERKKQTCDMENQRKSHSQQTEILQGEISRLNDLVQTTNSELESLRSEYEGYKLRAQSVLRTKQSQNKESGLNGRSVSEVETELSHLRLHSTQLQVKLDRSSEQLKAQSDELALVREERDAVRASAKDLGKKLSLLSQDHANLREQCRGQLNTLDELRNELETTRETLKTNYDTQISTMAERHAQELEELRVELQKVSLNSSTYAMKPSTERSGEIKIDHEYQSRSEMHLLEREDGEGSESIDPFSVGSSAPERDRRPPLMPLDELLNSPDDFARTSVSSLPAKVDRQDLEVAERRIKHLTALLADAERDVAKLNQMNQLLKEDIRRHQRSIEREHHANNFEYLKNVVFKFVTLKNGDERSRLVPVLNTILKLSPAETQQLHQVTEGRSWLPAIPGWSND